jgi:hypothetical protein
MLTVTSFESSHLDADQLNAVMAAYLKVEEARVYRQLFLTRFGILAVMFAIAGFGLQLMPLTASWISVAACVALPLCAWIAELRCDRVLGKRLHELPEESHREQSAPRKS